MGLLEASNDVIVDAWKQSVFAYKIGDFKKNLDTYLLEYYSRCLLLNIEKEYLILINYLATTKIYYILHLYFYYLFIIIIYLHNFICVL
jgi:hypothetical protein